MAIMSAPHAHGNSSWPSQTNACSCVASDISPPNSTPERPSLRGHSGTLPQASLLGTQYRRRGSASTYVDRELRLAYVGAEVADGAANHGPPPDTEAAARTGAAGGLQRAVDGVERSDPVTDAHTLGAGRSAHDPLVGAFDRRRCQILHEARCRNGPGPVVGRMAGATSDVCATDHAASGGSGEDAGAAGDRVSLFDAEHGDAWVGASVGATDRDRDRAATFDDELSRIGQYLQHARRAAGWRHIERSDIRLRDEAKSRYCDRTARTCMALGRGRVTSRTGSVDGVPWDRGVQGRAAGRRGGGERESPCQGGSCQPRQRQGALEHRLRG